MNNDPSHNFELSRETLENAWHDLAEATVIGGEEVEEMQGVEPPSLDGPVPYGFKKTLESSFVREKLMDHYEEGVPVEGEATYLMPRKLEEEDDEVLESISLAWEFSLPRRSDLRSRHFVTVRKITTGSDVSFEGTTFIEYSQLEQDGSWKRVATHTDGSEIERARKDSALSEGDITVDDVEKIHAAAAYIRSGTASR